MNEEKIDVHPYEPFIPKGARKLIIGTIPPSRFCRIPQVLYEKDVDFYYGSKDNYFWTIMNDIFEKDLKFVNDISSINQRKELLKQLNTGITDIVEKCIRADNSASDRNLKILNHKDLASLLADNPSIETLIYTSEFVKTQINIKCNTYHVIEIDNKKKQTVKIGDKPYKVRILYSPSPQALRNMGENGNERRKNQYREFLANE
jgi:G:T/U-mismatch repair DNA glycosylase